MRILAITLALAAGTDLRSQERILTGNLRYDLMISLQADTAVSSGTRTAAKSPLRAALFSAVIPGTGEFYVGEYWKSASFFTAEVALWVVYAVYNSRGDKVTEDFQRYADLHWSVVKYADWVDVNASALNPDVASCPGLVPNRNPSLPPWEQVDWSQLNQCEEAIGKKTGSGFTHRLPRRPEQQYYELIGKYEQYNAGWDDSNATPSDFLSIISPRFKEYRDMRGRANRLYNIAATAGYVVVANHVFSALDAALSATYLNRNLHMEAHLKPTLRPFGFVEFVPTASMTITF